MVHFGAIWGYYSSYFMGYFHTLCLHYHIIIWHWRVSRNGIRGSTKVIQYKHHREYNEIYIRRPCKEGIASESTGPHYIFFVYKTQVIKNASVWTVMQYIIMAMGDYFFPHVQGSFHWVSKYILCIFGRGFYL